MHLFSAPLALGTITEESYPVYREQLRAAAVTRVLLCGVGEIKAGEGILYEDPARLERAIKQFHADGFEVWVWLNALGHGCVLAHTDPSEEEADAMGFAHIVGLDGRHSKHGVCPTDARLIEHFARSLQTVAAMHPDLILLDDDFRLNVRDTTYDIGCFCENHLAAFYERVGEVIPREQLREKLFVGKGNRYRSAWMAVMGESLLHFARRMRAAVDAVDPAVRLAACMCYDTWDLDGVDGIQLARAFAGNTKPFLRTIGAPYHDSKVAAAVESTRMQAAWCRGQGIEVFAEGDVYPRPRYTVPSKFLELFDLALLATGEVEGNQKYMFDYTRRPNFETGYVERHVKNQALRQGIESIFADKHAVGVQVFEAMRKVEQWDIPTVPPVAIGRYLHKGFHSRAARWLSEMAVPTAYAPTEYPLALFGENARHVELEALKNGALLDAAAARILTERGVDVGLRSCTPHNFSGEYYKKAQDRVMGFAGANLCRITCDPRARVLSELLPDGTPGAYLYENEAGARFYLLAVDTYAAPYAPVRNYYNNYYRQQQLQEAIAWVGRKPLPAVCTGNPYLYMICAKNAEGTALSVALFNVFEDEIPTPVVTLDREYSSVRFVGCEGTLVGNQVTLSELAPFGVAAFEVHI